MCNIAAYIGKKQAAPILIEMMKKQEGFWAGYYTGISVHDGTTIHTMKVIGDMQNFLTETNGSSLSGTIGFMHSRSNSGGDVEWGHPFMSSDGNLSYIANGADGVFATEEMKEKRRQIIRELEECGYVFRSKSSTGSFVYPTLSDGSSIHVSDLMCQYIAYCVDRGMSPDEAMSHVFSELPAEVVGLCMLKKHPDSIFVSRINCPMMIGITDDGDTYLATTAMAFPDDVTFRTLELLPPATTFRVFAGGYHASAYPIKLYNIAPITPDIWHKAYSRTEQFLTDDKKTPAHIRDVIAACADLWPEGSVHQGAPLVYEILRSFHKENRLKITLVEKDNTVPGYHTNEFHLSMI